MGRQFCPKEGASSSDWVPGPRAGGRVAPGFLQCRQCLKWRPESAMLSVSGKRLSSRSARNLRVVVRLGACKISICEDIAEGSQRLRRPGDTELQRCLPGCGGAGEEARLANATTQDQLPDMQRSQRYQRKTCTGRRRRRSMSLLIFGTDAEILCRISASPGQTYSS